MRTFLYTLLALVAFAANSVICRLALGGSTIDAASFSTIRLASGAVMLLLIAAASRTSTASMLRGDWISAGFLLVYAVGFSLAYVSLSVGTGALILFGSVQATMIISALVSGERPNLLEWVGLVVALGGLIYLVSPGIEAPPVVRSALMALAGVSWGFYSLRGRGSKAPLADTTRNFVRSVPLVLAVNLALIGSAHVSVRGSLLAVLSGALASGVGYVIWYAALKGLTATKAATVQLAVPVLAAAGGVVLLSEGVSLRLILSGILILGGVGLAMGGRELTFRLRTARQ
jgi:drug/metabolite transporter (DMT)-like permease